MVHLSAVCVGMCSLGRIGAPQAALSTTDHIPAVDSPMLPLLRTAGGVYTVHVQGTGQRFATGGADSLVKVWSMAPVRDVQKEKAGPLVLATLSDHTSTVNAVRFSKNGRFLASGALRKGLCRGRQRSLAAVGSGQVASAGGGTRIATATCGGSNSGRLNCCSSPQPTPKLMPAAPAGSDDRMICIYEHKPGAGASVLGNSGGANIENWRTKLVLRGHSNNVVDLGWSPDDSKLASASIDNAVCIWDTATGHRLKTLDFHTSFVKGLAWDPVGTYLATQVRACVCLLAAWAGDGAACGLCGSWWASE